MQSYTLIYSRLKQAPSRWEERNKERKTERQKMAKKRAKEGMKKRNRSTLYNRTTHDTIERWRRQKQRRQEQYR